MEPHMIEYQLYSFVFVIWINHVGFIGLVIKLEKRLSQKNSSTPQPPRGDLKALVSQ
jgi:hypothetical protein